LSDAPMLPAPSDDSARGLSVGRRAR
jgi:hypothetical protein